MSDPKAGGALVEILHAIDGRAVAVIVMALALAGFAAVMRRAPSDLDAMADPDAYEAAEHDRWERGSLAAGDLRRLGVTAVAVLGVLLLAFVLAGCGPDEDEPTPDLSACLETSNGLGC